MPFIRMSHKALHDYSAIIAHTFGAIEIVEYSECEVILEVHHEEVPEDATFIEPLMFHIHGIVPFVVDWGIKTK